MMFLVFGSLVLVYFVESNVFQGGRAGDFPASGLKHHFEERECTVLCFDSSCLVILIFTALINVDLFFFLHVFELPGKTMRNCMELKRKNHKGVRAQVICQSGLEETDKAAHCGVVLFQSNEVIHCAYTCSKQ